MRWMLGLLVVANISIFVWGITIGRVDSLTGTLPLGNLGAMNISSPVVEVAPAAVPAPTPTPTETAQQVAVATTCAVIGPVSDEAQAQALLSALQQDGFTAKIHETEESRESGYWVLIPAAADSAAAKQNEEKLKAAGIDDLWRFRKGELKHAISLGLYDRRPGAEVWAKKVKAKGFEVTVHPKMSSTSIYRVSYSGSAAVDVETLVARVAAGTKITMEDCK